MAGFKDHFSARADAYAAFRPTYPDALVDYLAALAPARAAALDVGCGTGQLSVPLARRFARVVATDPSRSQLANAVRHDRVDYREALAERSGLPARSVDLVAAAQAAHWFDLDAFYAEVRRVARPGAVLALVSYGVVEVEGDADAPVQDFYAGTLAACWPPERRLVEEGYRTLPFPFDELEAPRLDMAVSWTLAELLGYVGTWSAVRRLEQRSGGAPLAAFEARVTAAWGPPGTRRRVRWPLNLRLGRVENSLQNASEGGTRTP